MSAYNTASEPLKLALCKICSSGTPSTVRSLCSLGFVLELGLAYFIESEQDIEDRKAFMQDIVDWQKAEVLRWDVKGE